MRSRTARRILAAALALYASFVVPAASHPVELPDKARACPGQRAEAGDSTSR